MLKIWTVNTFILPNRFYRIEPSTSTFPLFLLFSSHERLPKQLNELE